MKRATTIGNGHGIEAMSYSDLVTLQNHIAQLIEQKRASEKAALREKFAALAKRQGFDITELVGGKGRGRSSKVAPKYQDPANPENTWTGRGRMPRWMSAATKSGRKHKEDFLISA